MPRRARPVSRESASERFLLLVPYSSADGVAGGGRPRRLGPVLHALGLTATTPSSSTTYVVSQGAEKGRPARLEGRLVLGPQGEVAECLIGGEVLKVGEGWVSAPRKK